MARVVAVCDSVRREGWSTLINQLTAEHLVIPPSAFECSILMLPSPIHNPTVPGPESAAEIITLAILDLIRQFSGDPIMLLKFDSLLSIMGVIHSSDLKACTLRLGCAQREEHDSQDVMYIRIKLASILLDKNIPGTGKLRDIDLLEMIGRWKNSDIELCGRWDGKLNTVAAGHEDI
ncbi:hypothetical protein BJX63DRAFT_223930 [Aspergillus granulosus]|uniref:Uncharacterized protein n=1 Tax=Aspergillus granulosus TaxID=176169 RepID=A0ABR4I489_9EURO